MKILKEFLKDEGGWINYALMGAGALASYLSGKSNKTATSSSTTNSTSTSTPQLDPEIQSARSKVLQSYLSRLSDNNSGYLTSYTGNALKTANKAGDLQQTALDSILASRGLTGSVAGAALKQKALSDTYSEKINALSQVPLLSRQLNTEDLQGLSGVVASAPYGTTNTGTSTTTGTNVNQGSAAAGLEQGASSAMSIAALLNKYYPQGW